MVSAWSAKRVFYSGNVQGVGFRFTARAIGQGLGISGFVKNLIDGSVEVFAEGEEALLKRFFEELEAEFSGYIRDVRKSDERPTGKAGSFRVEF